MAGKLLCAALAVFLGIATKGCAPQGMYGGASARTEAKPSPEYRIGPEDELHITVWKNDILTRTVPVRPDGMISLPLLNDVKAAGLTPMQLRDSLKKKLGAYISNPEVSVIVQKIGSFKVSVMGEVFRPGTYEISGRSTVLDVLARAEGLTEWASRSRIVVLRSEGEGTKRIPFNYNRAISADGQNENFHLRPGDIVVVP